MSVKTVLNVSAAVRRCHKFEPLRNENFLGHFLDGTILLSPQVKWILEPWLVDHELQLAPLPVHIVILGIAVLEALVKELGKLNHMYERVSLVGELEQDRTVSTS